MAAEWARAAARALRRLGSSGRDQIRGRPATADRQLEAAAAALAAAAEQASKRVARGATARTGAGPGRNPRNGACCAGRNRAQRRGARCLRPDRRRPGSRAEPCATAGAAGGPRRVRRDRRASAGRRRPQMSLYALYTNEFIPRGRGDVCRSPVLRLEHRRASSVRVGQVSAAGKRKEPHPRGPLPRRRPASSPQRRPGGRRAGRGAAAAPRFAGPPWAPVARPRAWRPPTAAFRTHTWGAPKSRRSGARRAARSLSEVSRFAPEGDRLRSINGAVTPGPGLRAVRAGGRLPVVERGVRARARRAAMSALGAGDGGPKIFIRSGRSPHRLSARQCARATAPAGGTAAGPGGLSTGTRGAGRSGGGRSRRSSTPARPPDGPRRHGRRGRRGAGARPRPPGGSPTAAG